MSESEEEEEEEPAEEVGEAERRVLKDMEPEKSPLLRRPILTLSRRRPSGHPPSCTREKPSEEKLGEEEEEDRGGSERDERSTRRAIPSEEQGRPARVQSMRQV